MTRQDLIEHAAYIITEAPELEDCRRALYRYYRAQRYADACMNNLITSLLVDCLYWYYSYIDLHVSRDDIEFHLWGCDELFILNKMLFESYTQNK